MQLLAAIESKSRNRPNLEDTRDAAIRGSFLHRNDSEGWPTSPGRRQRRAKARDKTNHLRPLKARNEQAFGVAGN